MRTIVNPVRDLLANGHLALGAGLRLARTVEPAKVLKTAGFDWLFIDAERNAMGVDAITRISTAAYDAGIMPFVRVPHGRFDLAARALDGGAMGIIMPRIESAAEAKALVDAVKYAPIGERSFHPWQPAYDFATGDYRAMMAELNAATMVIAMIESPESAAQADAIAAVEGIDALLVGNTDLTCAMGIPGEVDDPRVSAVYDAVIAACRTHGKWAGLGGPCRDETRTRLVAMGVRLVYAAGDLELLMSAARQRVERLRGDG